MKSYLMVITAMLIWGSSGVFRRYIPVPSDFLAFLRGVLGSLFMLCLILYYKKKGMNRIPAKTVGMLLLAGAMYGFNWIFFFEAINYTTVPIATLCYYMQPALVILLSPLFLQEKLTRGKIVVLCLTTTGMVLVSGITETESVDVNQLKGVIFGLSAGLLYALNAIINKRISKINTYHKTFIQLTGAVITLIPYLFIVDGWRPIPTDGLTIISVLILGIVHTGIAFALYFASMKTLSAPSVALCGYIDPISALFLSALVLDETLTVTGVLGAVLIIGTAVVSEIKASTVK
ncbi:DMT family transporter [Anaerovibrio sp. RM50]|uniref:DMT family transporter n=1 Tax=Anaerovibrio sp. RM50 TaxID=1200557 RepID=UPI00048072C5|nr:DMT family transporter [Anaerovibrio sp. RM50]